MDIDMYLPHTRQVSADDGKRNIDKVPWGQNDKFSINAVWKQRPGEECRVLTTQTYDPDLIRSSISESSHVRTKMTALSRYPSTPTIYLRHRKSNTSRIVYLVIKDTNHLCRNNHLFPLSQSTYALCAVFFISCSHYRQKRVWISSSCMIRYNRKREYNVIFF